MRSTFALFTLAFAWTAAAAQAQQDQPQFVLDKAKSARAIVRTLSRYPEDIRHAVPVVAQHSRLVGDLLDAVNGKKPGAVEDVIREYPPDVQAAARKLAAAPEVLETLLMNKTMSDLIGQLYKKEGEATLKAIATELRNESEMAEASIDAWARRLNLDRKALKQYLDAIARFHEESPKSEYLDYGVGVAVTANRTAVIYALPTAPLTAFVMVNADEYPNLADEMVEQWLQSKSQEDFDHVLAQWWGVIRQHFAVSILNPGGRMERLAALASLGKKLGTEKKGQMVTMAEREKFLRRTIDQYPVLKPYLLDSPPPPLKPGEEPEKPRVAAMPPPAPPLPKVEERKLAVPPPQPNEPAEPKPVPEKVDRGQANAQQQARRGSQSYYYWSYHYGNPYTYGGYYNPYYTTPAFNWLNAYYPMSSYVGIPGYIGIPGFVQTPLYYVGYPAYTAAMFGYPSAYSPYFSSYYPGGNRIGSVLPQMNTGSLLRPLR